MIQFLIATEQPLSSQLKPLLTLIMEEQPQQDWTCVICPKDLIKPICQLLTDLWPERCLLANEDSWSIGEILVTDLLSPSPYPKKTCIINTITDLMIPEKACKVCIEVITEHRAKGREKYRHYQQTGSTPHVKHINNLSA